MGAFYTWVQNNDANWDYGSNYLPPTDGLQNIGTGFELWNDGYNLASQGTWINLTTSNASPSPSPSASASPTGSWPREGERRALAIRRALCSRSGYIIGWAWMGKAGSTSPSMHSDGS